MPSIDLTGANLTAYMLDIVQDVVNRIPRFRSTLGQTSIAITSNQISFGDVQVIIKDVTAAGERLSPDYFMGTQLGRAVVAKVENHDGRFIEWAVETDNDGKTILPGVYYIAVTSDNANQEATQQVQFTIERYFWKTGSISAATGSLIYFSDALAGADVQFQNTDDEAQQVGYVLYNNYAVLTTPVSNLSATLNGSTLTPITDYYVIRPTTTSLTTTLGGKQAVTLNVSNYLSYSLVDSTGFTLRPGIDYTYLDGEVLFSSWTPPGMVVSVVGEERVSPVTNAINPENILPITLTSGQSLAATQISVISSAGNYTSLLTLPNGDICLPSLLPPGATATWDLRILDGQYTTFGQKRQMNNFVEWTQTNNVWGVTYTNGKPNYIIPGLMVGIGDQVSQGDQAAIIVSPFFTETYEVYGSKDNISFTLDIRANDYNTASEISEALRHALLVNKRGEMESDGVSILTAARTNRGEQRDMSGTALSFVFSLDISALCDWAVFIPLVNRVTNFSITMEPELGTSWEAIQNSARASVFGGLQFVQFIPGEK